MPKNKTKKEAEIKKNINKNKDICFVYRFDPVSSVRVASPPPPPFRNSLLIQLSKLQTANFFFYPLLLLST